MKYKEPKKDVCLSCGYKAPDGAVHQCYEPSRWYGQCRLNHDDIPVTVTFDNTDGIWQKLVLPLYYETKRKEAV